MYSKHDRTTALDRPAEAPMTTYEDLRASFSWDDVWDDFDWDGPERFNVAHETVCRHVGSGPAVYWEGAAEGERETLTYADLDERSARVANALESLGVDCGEPVATLVPRLPELYPTFLGIWRRGAVYVPLFTAFGPNAIEVRAADAGVRTVVTTSRYREKIAAVEDEVGIENVVVIDRDGADVDGDGAYDGDLEYEALVGDQPTMYETAETSADDLCTLEYTSGTTGPPKGCELTHRVLAALYPYLQCSMGLGGDETVWGAADPGWMYGLLTAGIAPVSMGVPNVFYEGEFDPEAWYAVMERYDVTSLATSPTAYRGLVAAGDAHESYDLSLRKGNSAGEPLNPEVMRWFDEELSVTVYDHYGVTECGMVAGNHHACEMDVKPGSMGRPLPGFDVRVVDPETGAEIEADEVGELAVARGEATYFGGYWNEPEKTAEAWVESGGEELFLTGDAAERDADDYLWFVGRADDVILSSGYRIGPFEVESTLLEHEAVAEAAVVGVPDETRGELVKAYVVTTEGFDHDDELAASIREFVRQRLAKHAYPREIEFIDELPKTSSGKIRRVELRE
ncbi:acyl-CoA synthetase [Haloprofundus salilacus]|uniref:acyl-CoA synthetase n=1 Tax=Haloprofundus salilacus TaxID=2876190 RepID=UPI001CCE94DF|nr:AMP-binding protein [Haloprofundus salilacus]